MKTNSNPSSAMIKHTNSPLLYVFGWMRRLVLRKSHWEIGTLGVLAARRRKIDGRVEIFAQRSNPEHSLWLETHKDHWEKFQQNEQAQAPMPAPQGHEN